MICGIFASFVDRSEDATIIACNINATMDGNNKRKPDPAEHSGDGELKKNKHIGAGDGACHMLSPGSSRRSHYPSHAPSVVNRIIDNTEEAIPGPLTTRVWQENDPADLFAEAPQVA